MQNLAHSASFESLDKDAPSKAETKHLTLTIEIRPSASTESTKNNQDQSLKITDPKK
jgi:hypothetical protein